MAPTRIVSALSCCTALTLALTFAGNTAAQTVWSGLSFEFEKIYFGDPTLPEYQDRITDSVWLTRAVQQGIFNIAQENFYDAASHTSPVDTEWATDLMLANDGEAIAASNWEDLTFTNWIQAYGGPGSQDLPHRIVGRNAVVHLISDDIYLDLQFTDWTLGAGGFAYIRAEGDVAPPVPTGDYNENGVVDAADYVVWRKTLNQPAVPEGSGADGDLSGTIDAGDYQFWRAHFGETVAGSGSAPAVAAPEPTTALLSMLCLLAIAARRIRN
jgi:hypothetical protein